MEKHINFKYNKFIIYLDILSIFRVALDINWIEIRQNSIFRILYLSSVLYSFRYPDKNNLFSNYNFTIDPSGPYDYNISLAISFLLKDDYLKRISGEDILTLGDSSTKKMFDEGLYVERFKWIEQVVLILGIYGEDKIYDFIFRDPQYQETIKSNTQQGLNTNSENETVKTLNKFKKVFEDSLDIDTQDLSNQKYLELYFEYIFSKILNRAS